ncbi:MAG TPA: 5'-nucleotidase C-terminal domain-containing protein, partial [Bryobacteraceae bacterium]|nr:5'-nucleotidase C-terminal domain-containing protein [Bryobacteraceae bacterium]
VVFRVASEVKGIDAIVFGHTHQTLPEGRIGEVLLVQPKNWGMSLGAIDLELSEVGGKWTVRSKRSRLIPVSADTVPDASVLELARPYHAAAEQYLETRVTAAPAELSAATSRVQDTALIDAIHEVQLHYGKADVSLASAFNPRAMVRKGPVTVRELAALYIYDNELYTLQGNGRVLRLALENAARIYTCAQPSCKSGAALDRSVPGYNLDLAQGVTYDVDATALAGQRIRNLRFRGKPLADEQPLKIAVNSYRAGGSGGYTMLRGLPVVWRSYEEIRDMMIRYYSSRTLPSAPDNNWRIVPDSARRALELEARRAAETAGTQ